MSVPEAWGQTYQDNIERYGDRDSGNCCLCGRPMGKKGEPWMVHLNSSGEIIEHDATPDDDMYWFPVGPECAKTVPLDLRVRSGKEV